MFLLFVVSGSQPYIFPLWNGLRSPGHSIYDKITWDCLWIKHHQNHDKIQNFSSKAFLCVEHLLSLELTGGGLWKTLLPLTPNSGLSQKSTYIKAVTVPSSDKIQVHCVNRSFKGQYLVLGWQMRTWKKYHLTCLAHQSEYQRGWKQHNDLAIIEWLNINYWNK